MARVNIQQAIADYHAEMLHHHGMDMHSFHSQWHLQNRDPVRPPAPDENWGMDNNFGADFLQMHHEMVKARANEPHRFMHHPSIVSWFNSKGFDLPAEWDPATPIPQELAFNPSNPAQRRASENPGFVLPAWCTLQGIGPGEKPEPITRAEKLSDFKNLNQLGCCIIYPHNSWHRAIGGAMLAFSTAIDDPIFYFGVHWHIDKVFDAFKSIQHPFVHVEKKRRIPDQFTAEEIARLKTAEELGIRF